jgi:hypothetical protein
MGFFEEVDASGIVERHIQEVLRLEEKESLVLLKRYREVRQELRDRLDRIQGDTFTAQQLRGVLAQVDGAIIAMNISLVGGMKEKAAIFARHGVDDSINEIQKFEEMFTGAVAPINIDRLLVASNTENFLFNQYEASISAYSEGLRSNLAMNLTNESLMESPYSTVVRKLGAFFQGEEWKLQRIARSELHNVYSLAKTNGLIQARESVLPDLKKTLFHPMDARTGEDSKHSDRLKLIVNLDEPFSYMWKGKKRTFFTIDRPNDRQIVVPYREAWDQ